MWERVDVASSPLKGRYTNMVWICSRRAESVGVWECVDVATCGRRLKAYALGPPDPSGSLISRPSSPP